jgi:large subunit ribosomal protein L24e
MVVKRQCSFCAGEVEPGTGTMFVKRDGTVFYFCSSSCRKQQLHLGRVGHRLKWTRAHALKRASQQSTAARAARAVPTRERAGRTRPAPTTPAAPAPAPPTPVAAEAGAKLVPPAKPAAGKSPKPRAKKPKPASKPAAR